ncbi:MAG: 4-hydroxythreonine-4-phosphate dehydrogenase PdxA [Candidatus Eisenbacteria bacterium]|nr:4-hydroxythreonine-4-phosphate dehydrogenase PdxA [Candidatus Eisenbacteria bacterium]
MGDPAGIGPEIILKLLRRPAGMPDRPLVVVGDRPCMEAAATRMGGRFTLPEWNPMHALPARGAVFCQATKPSRRPVPAPGKCGAASGRLAADAILTAAALCNGGLVAGMVTAPVNKEALRRAGVPFPGHTEWLAQLSGSRSCAMLFAGERLKVVLATIHLPLAEVPKRLTAARIVEVTALAHAALVHDFGIRRPRIAVAGLNPHAGEHGLLGREDARVVAPAVRRARSAGMEVSGPYPGDTVFRRALEGEFHLVVGLYHDQGLGPIKTLEGFRAVNVTLGLPWVRTSVDHGTAEDIAGRGVASSEGLRAAVRLAAMMAGRR